MLDKKPDSKREMDAHGFFVSPGLPSWDDCSVPQSPVWELRSFFEREVAWKGYSGKGAWTTCWRKKRRCRMNGEGGTNNGRDLEYIKTLSSVTVILRLGRLRLVCPLDWSISLLQSLQSSMEKEGHIFQHFQQFLLPPLSPCRQILGSENHLFQEGLGRRRRKGRRMEGRRENVSTRNPFSLVAPHTRLTWFLLVKNIRLGTLIQRANSERRRMTRKKEQIPPKMSFPWSPSHSTFKSPHQWIYSNISEEFDKKKNSTC